MKSIIFIILLFLSSVANAIQVSGEGKTLEEAKQNAFANAIQIYVGSLVLSERESKNYELVKNEIFVYSSGYVKDFKIISSVRTNRGYIIVIDVTVESSKISDRIIGKSKDVSNFEGSKHQVQIQTLLQEKISGDRLLNNILSDYPLMAYTIDQQPQYVTMDSYRNIHINVPYSLSWNDNYVRALSEVLDKLEDAKPKFLESPEAKIIIQSKAIGNYFNGQNVYRFNDVFHVDNLANKIANNQFVLKTTIKTQFDTELGSYCSEPLFKQGRGALYSIGDPKSVIIYGSYKEKGILQLKVEQPSRLYEKLNEVKRITVQIVRAQSC